MTMGFRVFYEVLDVVADLSNVMPHGELDVTIALHRSPQQIFTLGCAVDFSRRMDRGQWIQVSENNRHGYTDIGKTSLQVVPCAIATQFPPSNPPEKLFAHASGLTFTAFPQKPQDVSASDPRRVGKKA